LASSGQNQIVNLWDVPSGRHLVNLHGHLNSVLSVSYSPDGRVLASGSADETIRLWDVKSGECINILRSERPYERMNITGATGLTEAQQAALMALGAISNG
jgi:WD40 repeat protein